MELLSFVVNSDTFRFIYPFNYSSTKIFGKSQKWIIYTNIKVGNFNTKK